MWLRNERQNWQNYWPKIHPQSSYWTAVFRLKTTKIRKNDANSNSLGSFLLKVVSQSAQKFDLYLFRDGCKIKILALVEFSMISMLMPISMEFIARDLVCTTSDKASSVRCCHQPHGQSCVRRCGSLSIETNRSLRTTTHPIASLTMDRRINNKVAATNHHNILLVRSSNK